MAKYKVVTNKQETEIIEADSVELNENSARLTFRLDGELVAAFVGVSSFCKLPDDA